jgi:hypothetical protein
MPSIVNNYGLRYGNTNENLIVEDENPANFESLLNGLLTEYKPETDQHHAFVEQLALSHWYLWRRQRAVNAMEKTLYSFSSNPINWMAADFNRLTILGRYKTSAERSLKRALQNAEAFRKERISQQNHLQRQEKWRAEQDIRERRLKLQEDKQAAAAAKAANKAAAKARNTVPEKPPINWPPDGHIPGRRPTPQGESDGLAAIPDQPNR